MAPNLTRTPLHWLPPLLAGDGRPCWQPLKGEGSWSSSVSVRRVLGRVSCTDSLAVPVSNVRRPFCLAAHGQYEKAIGQRAAGKARGEGGGFVCVVLGWASWLMLKMFYTELAWEISRSCGFDPVFQGTHILREYLPVNVRSVYQRLLLPPKLSFSFLAAVTSGLLNREL